LQLQKYLFDLAFNPSIAKLVLIIIFRNHL